MLVETNPNRLEFIAAN